MVKIGLVYEIIKCWSNMQSRKQIAFNDDDDNFRFTKYVCIAMHITSDWCDIYALNWIRYAGKSKR